MIGFAHRGGSAHGPDNTIETFHGALERGASGLETDAWLTADGQVVLDHDGVKRVALLRREPIAEVRRDELPSHIPTLEDVYAACGTGFDLAVDVSSQAIAAAVADVARRAGAQDRLWLVAPHSKVLAGTDAPHRIVTIYAKTVRGPRRGKVFGAIHEAGLDGVNTRWPWWTPRFVAEAHDLGLLAFGYDAQAETSIRRCVELGLDAVFSDHVGRMVRVLGTAGDGD